MRVKTKACEHCNRQINVKYSVCPLCGGHQNTIDKSLPPRCPRCKIDLQIHISDSEEYDICPQCGGMWLDKDEFHRATREHVVYKKINTKKPYIKTPYKDPVQYIPCVRCGKYMNRKNFARISGVIIDICKAHGIWLDAGELDKIKHFIADGGLDRARDREIEQNKLKLKELATTVNDTSFSQKLIHFWNFKRILFRGLR